MVFTGTASYGTRTGYHVVFAVDHDFPIPVDVSSTSGRLPSGSKVSFCRPNWFPCRGVADTGDSADIFLFILFSLPGPIKANRVILYEYILITHAHSSVRTHKECHAQTLWMCGWCRRRCFAASRIDKLSHTILCSPFSTKSRL